MPDFDTSVWVVHKFGGTSVLNAERYKNVADILTTKCEPGPKAVVVSAMKGVTDDLFKTVEMARLHDTGFEKYLEDIHLRHRREVEAMLAPTERDHLLGVLDHDVKELREILRGIWLVRAASPETTDRVSGMGEVWSAQILCGLFRSRGVKCDWLDARDVVIVRYSGGRVEVDWEKSRERFAGWRARHDSNLVVITGYVAGKEDGTPATLGRNGSDFSGAIFGELYASPEIFIWTDVDGVLSADPRRVPEAVVLNEMSYSEISELAYFGAKVVHPATIAPAVARGSTIWIKNTFRPDLAGTKIHSGATSDRAVKGFSTADNMCLVNVEGPGMAGIPGIAERLFGALRGAGVSAVLISQGSSEHSICLALPEAQSELARVAIDSAFAAERSRGFIRAVQVVNGVSILAAVGDGMSHRPGIAGEFFTSLGLGGVNVRAIAQGSSERNISAVIDSKDSTRALRAVHSAFVLPRHRLALGLIGPGLIGGAFLRQLKERSEALRRDREIDIQVLAIADSKRMLLSEQPLTATEWRERIEAGAVAEFNPSRFAEHLQNGPLPHAAIIEATASDVLVPHYNTWLRQGLHVITPNKKANAGDIEEYRKIHRAARESNRRFLYSTNVGAGLPILQTIRDLRATGDEILRVQGILSGTLSYLFNSFDGERSFSNIVAEARAKGYTEPDPREDLGGLDVARKAVILAREAGIMLSLCGIRVEGLVPDQLKSCSRDEFLIKMAEMDGPMGERVRAARNRGLVLRFIADVGPDGARVALSELPQVHPFARVGGTDNIVSIQTKRYFEQPLLIQGPGAGPEVTAAGVFADVLRLASYLGASP